MRAANLGGDCIESPQVIYYEAYTVKSKWRLRYQLSTGIFGH